MQAEELNKIYYINKEIERLYKDLKELEMQSFYKPYVLSDMPRGGEKRDIFSEYASDKKNIEDMIKYSLAKLQTERKRVEDFLNTIEDAEARLIIRLRIINNMRWEDIGREIGMDRRTASRKFYRFLKSCPQCPL